MSGILSSTLRVMLAICLVVGFVPTAAYAEAAPQTEAQSIESDGAELAAQSQDSEGDSASSDQASHSRSGDTESAQVAESDLTPTIKTQPESAKYVQGDAATDLRIVAQRPASGVGTSGTLTYQWYVADNESLKNPQAIKGEAYTSLPVPTDQQGILYYYCVVTNTYEGVSSSTISQAARIQVTSAYAAATPQIIIQPESAEIEYGGSFEELAVVAKVEGDGAGELTYQWYTSDSADGSGAEPVEGADKSYWTPKITDPGELYAFCKVTNHFNGSTEESSVDTDVIKLAVSDTVSIRTANDLVNLRKNVNESGLNYKGITVKLENDIDLSSVCGPIGDDGQGKGSWISISNVSTSDGRFAGVFDGNYHKIYNFYLENDGTNDTVGLFRNTGKGSILKDFTLEGYACGGGSSYLGAVVSQSYGTTFENIVCNVDMDINSMYAGGICGYAYYNGDIFKNCANLGSITNSYTNGTTGGICAYYRPLSNTDKIENCYNIGNIIIPNGASNNSGGLFGYLYRGIAENCYSSAIVESLSSNAGILVGYDYSTTFTNSYCIIPDFPEGDETVWASNDYGTQISSAEAKDGSFAQTLGQAYYARANDFPALAMQKHFAGAPIITKHPESAEFQVSENPIALTVEAYSIKPEAPLSYQWFKYKEGENPEAISGANQASYTPQRINGEIYYYCQVTAVIGGAASDATNSNSAKIVCYSGIPAATPVIEEQPQSIEGDQDSDYTLSVKASVAGDGVGYLTYQWYEASKKDLSDAAAIQGDEAKQPVYNPYPSSLKPGSTKYYYCVVTNNYEPGNASFVNTDAAKLAVDSKIYVSTPEQFKAIRDNVNSGTSYENCTIYITNDIDLTKVEEDWTAIGASNSNYFRGSIDGGYHSIKFNSTKGGLIGYWVNTQGAKNLYLDGSMNLNFTDTSYSYGALAQYIHFDDTNISNVVSRVSIVGGSNGRISASGLIGEVYRTYNTSLLTIERCAFTGSIKCEYNLSRAAGLLFEISTSADTVNMIDCYNTADITAGGYSSYYFSSGIVGEAPSSNFTMTNCYNAGKISNVDASKSYSYTIASSMSGNLVNCYALDGSASSNLSGCSLLPEFEMKDGLAEKLGDSFVKVEGNYPKLAWEGHRPISISTTMNDAYYKVGENAVTWEAFVSAIPSDDESVNYKWYESSDEDIDESDVLVGAERSFTPSTDAQKTSYYYCIGTYNYTNTAGNEEVETAISDFCRVEVGSGASEIAASVLINGEKNSTIDEFIYEDVELSVDASFDDSSAYCGDLSYQWYKGYNPEGADFETVVGGTDEALLADTSRPGDVYYYCQIRNGLSSYTFVTQPVHIYIEVPEVASLADLEKVRDNVNSGHSYEGITLYQSQDIDMSEKYGEEKLSWEPIGQTNNYFKGIYDGAGYSVKGFYINIDNNSFSYLGLFGIAQNATIKNLSIDGEIINKTTSSGAYAAGILGYASGDCTLENLINDVNISGVLSYAAGIAAYFSGSNIFRNCGNRADIDASGSCSQVGGITCGGNFNSVFYNCYNIGNLNNAYDWSYSGGVYGITMYLGKAYGCYNAGILTAPNYRRAIAAYSPSDGSGISVGNYAIEGDYSTTKPSASYPDFGPVNYVSKLDLASVDVVSTMNKAADAESFVLDLPYPSLRCEAGENAPIIKSQNSLMASYVQGDRPDVLSVDADLPAGVEGQLTYQWYVSLSEDLTDAVAIEGETSPSLVAPTASLPIGTNHIYCLVTNNFDGGSASVKACHSIFTITSTIDAEKPVIVLHPQSATYDNEKASKAEALMVGVNPKQSPGIGEYSYQWYKSSSSNVLNAQPIEGATSSAYIPDISEVGSAFYYCVVTNTLEGVKTASSFSDVAEVVSYNSASTAPIVETDCADDVLYAKGVQNQDTSINVTASLPSEKPGNIGSLSIEWYRSSKPDGFIVDEVGSDVWDFDITSDAESLETGSYYYYGIVTNTFYVGNSPVQATTQTKTLHVDVLTSVPAAYPMSSLNDKVSRSYTQGDTAKDISVKLDSYAVDASGQNTTAEGIGVVKGQWFRSQDESTSTPDDDVALADSFTVSSPASVTGSSYTQTVSTTGYDGTWYFYCKFTNTFENVKVAESASDMISITIDPKYNIYSAQDLKDLISSIGTVIDGSRFTCKDLTVSLRNDIDLGFEEWREYTSSNSYSFAGIFEGNGHTISGLSMSVDEGITTTYAYKGLFGTISGATVRNLTVQGSAYLTSASVCRNSNMYIGGIAGRAIGASVIENCKSCIEIHVDVTDSYGPSRKKTSGFGGIVGYCQSSSVKNCLYEGTIDAYIRQPSTGNVITSAGGIVGVLYSDAAVSNCYSKGDVRANHVGGIVGSMYGNVAISNCYYDGNAGNARDEDTAFNSTPGAIASGRGYTDVGSEKTFTCTYSNNYYNAEKTAIDCGSNSQPASNIGMSSAQMTGEAFVSKLNANTNAYDYSEGRTPILTWERTKPPLAAPIITKNLGEGAVLSVEEEADPLSVMAELPENAKGSLRYQWYSSTEKYDLNAVAIPGATGNTYYPDIRKESIQPNEKRFYWCVVTNTYEEETSSNRSNASYIWVLSDTPATAPSISVTSKIFDKEYVYAETVSTADYLTIILDDDLEYTDGSNAISYQWYTTTSKDDVPNTLEDLESDQWKQRAIAGATTYRYLDSNLTKTIGDKYYFCVIKNTYQGCKTSMTVSDVAHLSVSDVVKISTYDDLKKLYSSGASYEGVTVSIENDIVTTGNWSSPIGYKVAFKGVIEGNGHIISGVTIADYYYPVFYNVEDALIRDVVFEGTFSTTYPSQYGILVRQSKGSEYINVGCDFSMKSNKYNCSSGQGLSVFVNEVMPSASGKRENKFINCYAKSDFAISNNYSSGSTNMGAFVWNVEEGSNALFEGCYFNGTLRITTPSTDPLNVGAFAGSIASDTVIRSCYTSMKGVDITGHQPDTIKINPIGNKAEGAQIINSYADLTTKDDAMYRVNFDNGMPLFNDNQGMTRAQVLNQDGFNSYIMIGQDANPRLLWEGAVSTQYSINDIPDQPYTGNAIEPIINVSTNGQVLDQSAYKLVFMDNVDPGTARVYAVFQDGTHCVSNFTIVGKDFSVATIDPISTQVYTSAPVEPSITVRIEGKTLEEGKDYRLVYTNNVNVGTASVKIEGLGAYKGQYLMTQFGISGTLDSEVYISSAEELAQFAKDVNAGLITKNRTFYLTNDIDLSTVCGVDVDGKEVSWTPIGKKVGNDYRCFQGTFDGCGHVISNLYMNDSVNGLFYHVLHATIKNITLTGSMHGGNTSGGFAALANSSIFKNLINRVNMTDGDCGGIVGLAGASISTTGTDFSDVNEGNAFINCGNYGNIDTLYNSSSDGKIYGCSAGGIVSHTYLQGGVYFESCYNAGSLKGRQVGGMLGSLSYTNYPEYLMNMTNCYNVGPIELFASAGRWGNLIGTELTDTSKMGTIQNNYYLENNVTLDSESIGTGFTSTGQISMSDSDMKKASFVESLNLGDVDRYRYVEGSYPALSFEQGTRALEGEGALTIAGVADMPWTGDAVELSDLSVSDPQGDLVEGVDYMVSYSDNVEVGTATVTLSFMDRYYDSITKTFQIYEPGIQIGSDCIEVNAETSQLYKGTPISSELGLSLKYVTPSGTAIALVEGTDYAVSFKDNDAPGTATATITGRGRFAGTRELGFEIIRMSLGDGGAAAEPVSVEVPGSWFYTGSPIEPVPVVRYGDQLLSSGTDFTCTYSNNVEVGTQATVTVTAAGYYAGSCEATFEIQQPVFGGEGSSVAIAPIEAQTYTGSQIRPEVTLVSNGEAIDASAFEVTYGANTDVATGGTVTVATREGSPYGEGSITAAFEIEPLDFSADAEVVEATAESAYTGSPVYASSVKVALGGRELAYGSDYVVDPEGYSSNVEAGEARLTVVGTGNYSGSVLGSYEVAPADASEAVVSCDGGTYTGSPVEPEATVRFNGQDVTESFDVSYEDNVDAGEATVRATAKAGTNFAEGTSTSSAFAIEKGAGPSVHGVASTPESIEGYTKDGTIQGVTESMEWRAAGSESWAPVEGDSVAGLACGTYEVRHAETANTFAGAGKAVAVAAAGPQVRTLSASAASVDLGSLTYGASKAQAVTVGNTGNVRQSGIRATSSNAAVAASVNAASLEPGASLSLNVSATKANVGTYSSDVKVTSSENPTGVTVRVTLTVSAKQASALTIEGVSSKTYTGSAQTQAITVKDGSAVLAANTHYTVSYANNVNAGTATVTVTGRGNYSGTKSASFAIAPMAATPAVRVAQASVTYAGKAVSPAVTVTAAGRALAASDYAVAYSGNAAPGRATVKVTLRGNYAGSGSATFNILPKKVTIKAPVAAKKALTVKWAKGAGVTGYEILVATNKKFTAGKKTVKVTKASTVSKKVTGLKSKKTYYVKIRAYKAVGSTKLYSAWSAVKSKKTK